jgi:hypothetical protein
MRSESQQNRDRAEPIYQEIYPEGPITIPPIRAHETARAVFHQRPGQRQIFRDKQVFGRVQQLLKLQDLGQVSAARTRQ